MCGQCQAVRINGHLCHEHGCPVSYKDHKRTCAWCGQLFTPDNRHQKCCEDSCYRAYVGLPDESEED